MQITAAHLRAIANGPAPLAAKLVGPINRYAAELGLDTPLRMAHWLAHMSVETQGFKRLEENLVYTTAKRIRDVWPSRFKTDAAAQPYVRNPVALAEKVYGMRRDLGNDMPGDGWKYRGAGPMQNTGKANARSLSKITGIDVVADPELLLDPETGIQFGAVYFSRRVAKFADADQPVASRKAVNGGSHGLAEFKAALARAKKALPKPTAAKPIPVALFERPEPEAAAAAPDAPGQAVEIVPDAPEINELVARAIKQKLTDVGYGAEVGYIDSDWGGKSVAAMSAFENDNGLPITGFPNDANMAALDAAEPGSRPISRARQEVTAKDLKEHSPILAETSHSKLQMVWGMVCGGAATVAGAVKSYFGDAWDFIAPARDIVTDIPLWGWGLIALGVTFFLHRKFGRIETARVEAERSGAITTTLEPGGV